MPTGRAQRTSRRDADIARRGRAGMGMLSAPHELTDRLVRTWLGGWFSTPVPSRRTGSTTSPTSSTPTGGRATAGACRTGSPRPRSRSSVDGQPRGGDAGAVRAGAPARRVTYLDGTPVGWCSISPRAEIPRLERSKLIRPLDDLPVWSIICVVVRGGHRRKGVPRAPARGCGGVRRVAAARPPSRRTRSTRSGRMDTTMAFVGTRSMFEKAGFSVVGTTDAVASRMPRLVMRRMI